MAPKRSKKNITTTTTAHKKLMHEKKAYEETISIKLEALPVPDMADAIWNRIADQLDLDMPENDGGGNSNGPSSNPFTGWMGKAGTFIFVTDLVLSFFLMNKKEKKAAPQTVITNSQSAKDTGSFIDSRLHSTELVPNTGLPKNNNGLPHVINEVTGNAIDPPADSIVNTVVSPSLYPGDTIQNVAAVPPPQRKNNIDTTVLKPKGRGVQGITDDSYKIVPKKDST